MVFFAIVGAAMMTCGYEFNLSALLGAGIALLGVEAFISIALIATRKRKNASFTVSTHNVGYNGFCQDKDWYRNKITRRADATVPRQTRFQQDTHAHIMCMQETGTTFNPSALRTALPHYDFLQAPHRSAEKMPADPGQADTVVGWDRRRFVKIGEGTIDFDSPNGGQMDTQMVLLHDKQSGKRILVASAHIDGFCIADFQKDRTLSTVGVGDEQLAGIRNVLETISVAHRVDSVIIGMDANSDHATHARRFNILGHRGYVFDPGSSPTFFDASVQRALKLDHIAVSCPGKLTLREISVDGRHHYAAADSYCDHTKVTVRVTTS